MQLCILNYQINEVTAFSYFVIGELFCNSLITLLCITKEALFKQATYYQYGKVYLC